MFVVRSVDSGLVLFSRGCGLGLQPNVLFLFLFRSLLEAHCVMDVVCFLGMNV